MWANLVFLNACKPCKGWAHIVNVRAKAFCFFNCKNICHFMVSSCTVDQLAYFCVVTRDYVSLLKRLCEFTNYSNYASLDMFLLWNAIERFSI